MANPTELTKTSLAANSSVARPSADTIDTTGTVPLKAGSRGDRFIVEVTNNSANTLTVDIEAGDRPPAIAAGLGKYTKSAIAQNAVWLFGPFDSSRFAQDNGDINVTFTPATSTPNASVRVYQLPA